MTTKGNERERPVALIVTAIEGIEATAAGLAERLDLAVEIAAERKAALRLLERRGFAVVVLDQMLADADPEGAELIWKHAGLAVPMEFSFALTGGARLQREMGAALARRRREEELAQAAAVAALDAEVKNTVTGFLLESRLALAEEGIPPQVEGRLKTLAVMAERMRERLGGRAARAATNGELRAAVN